MNVEKRENLIKSAGDISVGEVPRVIKGGPDDPYMVEISMTRKGTGVVPEGLMEIFISKTPKVPEERARDVIQHALIDMFGEHPPLYLVQTPNGESIPAYDWFDQSGQFEKMQALNEDMRRQLASRANSSWGRNSLWLVLNRQESSIRVGVMGWLADKMLNTLIDRHQNLKEA